MKTSLPILVIILWLAFHTFGCRTAPLTEAEAKTMVAEYVRTTMTAESFGLYDVELVKVNPPTTIDGDTAKVEFRTRSTLKSKFAQKLKVRSSVYDAQATFKHRTVGGWRLVKVDQGDPKFELNEQTKVIFEGRTRLARNALYGRFELFMDKLAAMPLADRQQLSISLKQFTEANLEQKRSQLAQSNAKQNSDVGGDMMYWSYDSLTDFQKFSVQTELNR